MTTPWTPPDPVALERIHRRYLEEIVEELHICPYARRSRELGRVHRPWRVGPSSGVVQSDVGDTLQSLLSTSPDVEIVLFTYIVPPDDPFRIPRAFESWHREVQSDLESRGLQREFYSVTFHPLAGHGIDTTREPASFVQEIRRSPDPIIQCVRVPTLEAVRSKAQLHAQDKLLAHLNETHPELALLAKSCVVTDSSLSRDIARQNFERWAQPAGLQQLRARLEDIHRERHALELRILPS